MRILVFGAGALGGHFGGKLIKAGIDVDLLVRPRRAAQLAARGLAIREPAGAFTVPARTVQAGEVRGAYDVVLLACKSYDLESALEAIAPAVGPGTAILPLLNGLAHIDALSARFGAGATLGGLAVVYAAMTADGEIERGATPFDGTSFGELSGERSARCDAILAALTAAGIAASVSANIRAEMWRKFM
jgi:2-dehydropantoate 2-reductase